MIYLLILGNLVVHEGREAVQPSAPQGLGAGAEIRVLPPRWAGLAMDPPSCRCFINQGELTQHTAEAELAWVAFY